MKSITYIINKYGENAVLITPSGQTEIKALLSPMLTNRTVTTWRKMTPLGEKELERYFFYCPPEADLGDISNTVVKVRGKTFEFVRAEVYAVSGVRTHWEAILAVREEDNVV